MIDELSDKRIGSETGISEEFYERHSKNKGILINLISLRFHKLINLNYLF